MICKRIYVAGPYSADNVMDVLRNIGRGIDISAELFYDGFAPFSPWLDYHYVLNRPKASVTIEDFYEYSLTWLEVSDALLVLPNYENSNGTKKEIAFAEERGIPVFYSYGDLIDYAVIHWGYDVHKLTFGEKRGQGYTGISGRWR